MMQKVKSERERTMKRAGVIGAALALPATALLAPAAMATQTLMRRPAPDPPATPADFGLPAEDVRFRAGDGVLLRGWFIPAPSNRGTIIFCQGHRGSLEGDLHYAPAFHAAGYNLLTYDFRAHGRSGGTRITMGYRERDDLLAAIEWLGRRGIHAVGLLGFSMGGAAAIVAAALSPNVKAVVTDSAFATVDSIVAGGLRSKGAPAFYAYLVGRLSILLMSLLGRCPIQEASPIRWVDKLSPRGLFIIHGGADTYVPEADARRLYAKAGPPKQIWIEPGAGHRGIDHIVGEEAYLRTILSFFDQFFPSPVD